MTLTDQNISVTQVYMQYVSQVYSMPNTILEDHCLKLKYMHKLSLKTDKYLCSLNIVRNIYLSMFYDNGI